MFTVHAIAAAHLSAVRTERTDASGHPVEHSIAAGGEPLRCCLRDAAPGERIMLFGYEPKLPKPSVYREIGPVFAHADACDGFTAPGYPPAWRGRPQVLRAYDAEGRIHPATRVHDGTDPERALTELLTDATVVRVDSRNVAYGCFMMSVTRTT